MRNVSSIRFAIFAVSLSVFACKENIESSYRVLSDTAGAQYASWLPRWLPVSAVDIHECHNIDSLETWGRFAFRDSAPTPPSQLRRIAPAELNGVRVFAPGGLSWWPSTLRGELLSQELERSGLDFYVDPGESPSYRLYLVLDVSAGYGYFFRIPAERLTHLRSP